MEPKINFIFIIVHLVWNICLANSSNKTLIEVCSHLCPGPLRNSSVVKQNCEHNVILDRCCLNSSVSPFHDEGVLGIDLSGCHLHHLNSSLQHFTHVSTVVLDDNPLEQKDVNDSQFYGLSMMDYLSLPSTLNCPGGNESWEMSKYLPQKTVCQGQLDLCTVDNFTCPHHSHCLPRGPGLKDCLCDGGFYGYKCLRSGHFPTEWYLIGLCSSTVAVSALLWCTQRRHVIQQEAEMMTQMNLQEIQDHHVLTLMFMLIFHQVRPKIVNVALSFIVAFIIYGLH
ncbi:all-trans retinoic acid-induced differentiation factor-like [Liolophura sinensis]|uniref:all-trans retinoic acid-induced differentiation factor-like n=1 Tax=Liolophura sinensis TaxID=3198878 RepID=UPI00315829D5